MKGRKGKRHPLLFQLLCLCLCSAASATPSKGSFLGKCLGTDHPRPSDCSLGSHSDWFVGVCAMDILVGRQDEALDWPPGAHDRGVASHGPESKFIALMVPAAQQSWMSHGGAGFLVHPGVPQFCVSFGGIADLGSFPKKRQKCHDKRKHQKQLRKITCKSHVAFGYCRWVGNRRYRWVHKRYRFLAKIRRRNILYQQYVSRNVKACPWHQFHNHHQDDGHFADHVFTQFHISGSHCFGDSVWRCLIKWLQGSRATSLLPTLARFLWDPWAGVRVGEASHPGPSGSRATQRKRDWHFQVPALEDAELAKALLAVLQQHSDRQANDNDNVREPPRKKG